MYAKAGARVVSCVGGMDMRREQRTLGQGAHIVVGTPGRLRDHLARGSLVPTHLRAVVLDESDEMIGTASCRILVCQYAEISAAPVTLNKKTTGTQLHNVESTA